VPPIALCVTVTSQIVELGVSIEVLRVFKPNMTRTPGRSKSAYSDERGIKDLPVDVMPKARSSKQ